LRLGSFRGIFGENVGSFNFQNWESDALRVGLYSIGEADLILKAIEGDVSLLYCFIHLNIVNHSFGDPNELNEVDFSSTQSSVMDEGNLRGDDESEKISEGFELRVVQPNQLV